MTKPTLIAAELSRVLPASILARIESGEIVPTAYPPRHETIEEARARQEKALASRLRMYHCPPRFKTASFADLTPEQNPDGKVTRWWAEGGNTLLLLGETKGTGKSHAAYATGNELVRNPGVWVQAWSMVDFVDAIKPGRDETAFNAACECELLILDEMGAERVTEWSLERTQSVIDARWRAGKRMLVDSNVTGGDFVDLYGERVVDRLLDGSWTVKFDGPSRRRPAPW